MERHRHPRAPVWTTTANLSVTLYQDSDGTTNPPDPNLAPSYVWCTVGFKLSQDVVLKHYWGPTLTTADADMVIINGATGTGETMAASAAYNQRSLRLQPGRNKIVLTMGGTAPTLAQVAVELNSYPGIIQ
jgi:hypothetical protein